MSDQKQEGPPQVNPEEIQVEAKEDKPQEKPAEAPAAAAKPPMPQMVPFGKFFKFCSPFEKVLYYVGMLSGIFAGAFLPALGIVIGEITVSFDPDQTGSDINTQMTKVCVGTQILGVIVWLFCYMYFGFWQHLAENVTFDLRTRYIEALLK